MNKVVVEDETDPVALVLKIQQWLEDPQSHLDDKSRRKILELIVTDHAEKIRRKERARINARDFLLLASVVTLLGTIGPKVYSFLSGASQ